MDCLRIAPLLLALAGFAPADVDDAAQARLDSPVTLHFPQATPFSKVLEAIRAAAGEDLKVEVAADASKKVEAARVKLDVEGIPLKAALTMAVRQAGLIYSVEGSTATVGVDGYKPPDPKELDARMKKVDTTAYAPGYSEEKFRKIEPGMTEAEVHKLLGRPLKEVKSRPQVDWYFGPPTLRVTADGGLFDTSGTLPTAYGYTIARAHPDGKIFEILGGYFDEVPRTIIGADLAEMKKRYGEPVAIHEVKATRYLIYSGSRTSASYRTRAIGVDSAGKVVDVVAGHYFE